MKKSASIIHKKINGSRIEVLPNYYHGDFSINNPQQYVMAINELIANRNRNRNLKSKSFDNTKTKSENEQRQLEERNRTNTKFLDER